MDKDVEMFDRELENNNKTIITNDVANQIKEDIELKIKGVEGLIKQSETNDIQLKKIKEKLDDTNYQNRYLSECISDLESKLIKATKKIQDQKDIIDKLKYEKKEIMYQKKKQELLNKDKDEY